MIRRINLLGRLLTRSS